MNQEDYKIAYENIMVANKMLDQEIERLNNIINEFNNAYSKVITKCNQMINSRYYMNEIAIKKYGEEIKDICYYYVGEAKELKGVDKE
jgi:Ni,Fe-hydrogenase III component G